MSFIAPPPVITVTARPATERFDTPWSLIDRRLTMKETRQLRYVVQVQRYTMKLARQSSPATPAEFRAMQRRAVQIIDRQTRNGRRRWAGCRSLSTGLPIPA